MNKKLVILSSCATLLMIPLVAFAIPAPISDLSTVMDSLLNFIWPVFIGLAIIAFIIAGVLFLTAGGDSGKISSARNALLWGIVGVVVGILAFSIPAIIGRTLGTGL